MASAIETSVIWNGLSALVEEMGSCLFRTAYSDVVREGLDFSTAICDAKGRLLAQGTYAPGHLGSVPYAVRAVIDKFSYSKIDDGDVFILNDPRHGSGHFPDFFLISPYFYEGVLMAFLVNTAHHVDVAGFAPGSMAIAGVFEAYQEGLRIPPVKIIQKGLLNLPLFEAICANSRASLEMGGDLQAQFNTNHVGAQSLNRLIKRHGPETFQAACNAILEKTSERMRSAIEKIPDGTYEFEDYLDDIGDGTDKLRIHVVIEVQGSNICVDLSRSDDQVLAGCNSYINYTRAYVVFAIRTFTDPSLPQNQGVIDCVTIKAREGSFFNPVFPAACGGRSISQVRLYEVVNGALAQALPDLAMAAFSHHSVPTFSGVDSTGKSFVMVDLLSAGYGAHHMKDGQESLSPVLNISNIPVEIAESLYPVQIKCLEFIKDSAGAGKFRGGLGIRKDYEFLGENGHVSLMGDRHKIAPYGMFGGETGRRASSVLIDASGERALHSKGSYSLRKGDVVSLRLSGGGGYGQPAKRDRWRVKDDLENELISHEGALESYGFESTF